MEAGGPALLLETFLGPSFLIFGYTISCGIVISMTGAGSWAHQCLAEKEEGEKARASNSTLQMTQQLLASYPLIFYWPTLSSAAIPGAKEAGKCSSLGGLLCATAKWKEKMDMDS